MVKRKSIVAAVALAAVMGAVPALAQNVKITPLGSHPGELCDRDRATIFEDPTGVRILYDAGQSVMGADDPRMGEIHAVLLSHAHGDHIGDRKMGKLGAGTCDRVETVSAEPHSTTAEIVAAKNAAIMMVADMGVFVAKKVENIRGKPVAACPEPGGAIAAPPPAGACLGTAMIGGTKTIKAPNAEKGVEVTIVHAAHANNVPRGLLSEPLRSQLAADNASIALGPPTGYVVKFTNGLTVYLSGDTGLHAEMKSIVNDYFKANLAVFNLGPNAVTAYAAAYGINELVKPASVIVSHPNEGATTGGKLRPQSRTAAFMKLVKGKPVHLAISDRTMEFDGSAKCVSGCQ